jgi:hypothetical protein
MMLPNMLRRSGDLLRVLKKNDLEPLRLDFNMNRVKVRLMMLLSPT